MMFPSWEFQLNVDFEYEIESSQATFSQPNRNHFTSSSGEEDGKLVNCEEKENICTKLPSFITFISRVCISQVSSEALSRKYDEMHENPSSIKRLNISE